MLQLMGIQYYIILKKCMIFKEDCYRDITFVYGHTRADSGVNVQIYTNNSFFL